MSKPLIEVDIEIGSGETVALMGPSGSGKSTLLRVLGGLQKADHGTVQINGTPVRTNRGAADPRVMFIHQDYQLIDFLTVRDNLRLVREVRGMPVEGKRIEAALDLVGLAKKMGRLPGELSGGEKQRVALARALVVGASVILADEPTGALDRENSGIVADLLRGLASQQRVCVLVATHDIDIARVMDRGLILADGCAVPAEFKV
ncbi:ATP-binding cassette domain-containing protein [Micromonospora sp. D93]|nr:ATP-binding cassette domain-containing protein [Micromonospora sp. D93]